MANGFCLNGAAYGEIDAERRPMRHSGNSLDATLQISAVAPRLFRNSEQ
jgi:hypothetical protein